MGIPVGGRQVSGARRRRRALRPHPERRDRGWRENRVPARVDEERKRSLAVDECVHEDVVVEDADRHDGLCGAAVDECVGGFPGRHRVRARWPRGAHREVREAHALQPRGTRAAVDGDRVCDDDPALSRVVAECGHRVEELPHFVDAHQVMGVGVEPGVERLAALGRDPQAIGRGTIEGLAAHELDSRTTPILAPPAIRVAIRLVHRDLPPITPILRRIRAGNVAHPCAPAVEPRRAARRSEVIGVDVRARRAIGDRPRSPAESRGRIGVLCLDGRRSAGIPHGGVVRGQDAVHRGRGRHLCRCGHARGGYQRQQRDVSSEGHVNLSVRNRMQR